MDPEASELVDVIVDDAVVEVWSQNHLTKNGRSHQIGPRARSAPTGYTIHIAFRMQSGIGLGCGTVASHPVVSHL